MRIFLTIAWTLLLIFFLGVVSLWYVNTPSGKKNVSQFASKQLARDVRLNGGIWVQGFPPLLGVSGLTIGNGEEGRAETLAEIGELEIRPAPLAWLRGASRYHYLSLADSRLNLERYEDGRTNWRLSESDEEPTPPEIEMLDLRNTQVTYFDVPQRIDISLNAYTQDDKVFVSGDGTYQGRGFGLKGEGGSLLTAENPEPYPVDLTLTVGHTTLIAKGTLDDPTHLKGMDVALEVKGADAAELFPLFGIALPPTSPYDVRGQLFYEDRIWKFSDFTGRMGNSDLSGNVIWDKTSERPKLTAEFISKKLDFADLGPLIGLAPKQAVSEQQQEKKVEQQVSPYVIPDVPLDITRLAAMDADVTFTGKQVISADLPLDDFEMKANLEDRILTLDPVKFGTANGEITTKLIINARQSPIATEGDFSFRRLSLARLMEGVGRKIGNLSTAEGYIGGTAHLQGNGKSLHDMLATSDGRVGLGMEGGSLSNLLIELIGLDVAQSLGFLIAGDKPVHIRCVVGNFGVKNGLMSAETFVIDTTDTNIQGGGTLKLGSEELDLELHPEPKDATMVSLRSPIDIKGTLKHPKVVIEKGEIAARGGLAAALAALAPIAAALAFIEPALGEDSDCAQLLREMNQDTGKTPKQSLVPKNAPAD